MRLRKLSLDERIRATARDTLASLEKSLRAKADGTMPNVSDQERADARVVLEALERGRRRANGGA